MKQGEATGPGPDGRTERGRRTREKIADAMLSLIDENQAHFPADKVAERAGVSRRLVFHHFADMAELAEVAVNRRLEQLATQIRPLPTEGPRDVRVAALAEQRARILESVTPARLAVMRLENPSPRIQEAVQQMLDFARLRLTQIFATELDPLPEPARTDLLDGLDAVTTWSAWYHWRGSGLSEDRARRAMAATVHTLLAGSDRAEGAGSSEGPGLPE
ncbi:TetR/AcrR family transcriptional regulator [Kitasatospora purpeofusca]|uniref:TetR/AcrR family transcriptional regulator n=1 Tax=Kitasatospora purpeofusca TaxID=67352 RepID=UPI002252BEE1|nr:TetR/AcrR family transcriptional regulator [Kitasatospora purpeofusca]MCX4755571.1 TetR/AcrR family transcriptional regulator [Kitasatospora purpeofusca]WSR36562.1 TetR/AcrR family transcriptional regulator [Kitasatospora purpeofusca]